MAKTNKTSAGEKARLLLKTTISELEDKIGRAYALAESGDTDSAVKLFHEIRCFADKNPLKTMVKPHYKAYMTANIEFREKFRAYIRQGSPVDAERRIVIFADSLGLPRPNEPLNAVINPDNNYAHATSYSMALREICKRQHRQGNSPSVMVEPLCQRYATTVAVLEMMDEVNLEASDVVVHVGLNDSSSRIFTDWQRLSMKLLPDKLVQKIVNFSSAKNYRRNIIAGFDNYAYVPFRSWRGRLNAIIDKANRLGARSVSFLNLVQLPMRVETHTPHYRFNIQRYNLELYRLQYENRAKIVDADRIMWEGNFYKLMHEDQMHISHAGHEALAQHIYRTIFNS